MNDHERYGLKDVCQECQGSTIVAKSYTVSPTVPKVVQVVCKNLKCSWRGPELLLSERKKVVAQTATIEPPKPEVPLPAKSAAKKLKKKAEQIEMF
ncbi:MAG TPA: hypothetical protein VJA26_14715 [Gammaproteobacteria bacterium]|nr:hypothetical protein [Gammaproteobacteria bacterium]